MKSFYALVQSELHRYTPKVGLDKSIQRNKLIEEIVLIVFKHDEKGNVLVNSKGNPKVDWIRTTINLLNILAKLFVLYLVNKR